MGFLDDLAARAAARPRRIAFPEWEDPRVAAAVERLQDAGLVVPVVVVANDAAREAAARRLPNVELVDASTPDRHARLVATLLDRRGARGLRPATADGIARQALFAAADLLDRGEVDGCVAGAVHATADVLRAGLWMLGTAPGVRTVSSAFYMVVPPFRSEQEEILTFTDCAVVPDPSPAQLADIAIAAAADRTRVVGDAPVIAFLSFATRGSAAGPLVDRVRAAVAEVRERAPELVVDGELQADAALLDAVAQRKAPGSAVAGRANVLVFPSLDAGNIGYKLVERLAGARAIGPIIQGLRRPLNDLSRGTSIDDIIRVAAITALKA